MQVAIKREDAVKIIDGLRQRNNAELLEVLEDE